MVELRRRTSLASFFCTEPLAPGRAVTLGEDEAHHARVRRLGVGETVRLVDGEGTVASGVLLRIARASATVEVRAADIVPQPPAVHLIVPVADRERLLWLAEKAAELAASSWRPVLWRRSRSVSPRGEGVAFAARARARMIGALTQSGGAWLPAMYPDATVERAIAAAPAGRRFLLDADGAPLLAERIDAPVTIALGPEGGVDAGERDTLLEAGFTAVSLGETTLRFETAGVAALAIVRAALAMTPEVARER